MKKIILLLFLFVFGCDKIPTGVVENQTTSFQTTGIKAPEKFIYSKNDSTFVTSIRFNSASEIAEVWLDVYTSDNSKLNSSPIYLADDGNLSVSGDSISNDMVFSARVPMSMNYSNGTYMLEYFVKDKSNSVRNVAVHNFSYVSVLIDTPPVVSNLSAADTLDTSLQSSFTLRITASDKDGLNDIKEVYFKLYRPDGTQTSTPKNYMYDNGNAANGDLTAGDGIFSYIGQLPSDIPKGNWKFVFQAADKSDSLSNIITHYINIK